MGALYWRDGNSPLPDHMNYDTKLLGDPTIQHEILDDSPGLKYENSEGSVSSGPHITNTVNLNDKKNVCLRRHRWIQSVRRRLNHIYIYF